MALELGRLAERAGALVLVDEVYKDVWGTEAPPSHLHLGPNFLAIASLTKCYVRPDRPALRLGACARGGGGADAARLRLHGRHRPMPTDALALAAFRQLPRLAARARAIIEPNHAKVREFLDAHRDRLAAVLPQHAMMVFPRLL